MSDVCLVYTLSLSAVGPVRGTNSVPLHFTSFKCQKKMKI